MLSPDRNDRLRTNRSVFLMIMLNRSSTDWLCGRVTTNHTNWIGQESPTVLSPDHNDRLKTNRSVFLMIMLNRLSTDWLCGRVITNHPKPISSNLVIVVGSKRNQH